MRVFSSYRKDYQQLKGLNEDGLGDLEMNTSGPENIPTKSLKDFE
jgi:hypothetical protein